MRRAVAALFSAWLATIAAAETKPVPGPAAKATFAGGCFWCMEPPFDALPGVSATISGYTGGHRLNPKYEEVSSGRTGHIEALQIAYDPSKISYAQLLDVFWRNVDPLDGGGQFCDRGEQYTTAIFYHNDEQKRLAVQSKQKIAERLGRNIVTPIRPAAEFYAAEDYHQNYYQRNPLRYKYYRFSCGRDKRLEQLWGKSD
ncbi:MAG: peptide-methionine (S)-S-oxide reductase MsrA [Gammaproteobacteria bacterium]